MTYRIAGYIRPGCIHHILLVDTGCTVAAGHTEDSHHRLGFVGECCIVAAHSRCSGHSSADRFVLVGRIGLLG